MTEFYLFQEAIDYTITEDDRKGQPSLAFWRSQLEASRHGYTTTHWAQIDKKDRKKPRGRHHKLEPFGVPAQCMRTSWTDEELALMFGLDPRATEEISKARATTGLNSLVDC